MATYANLTCATAADCSSHSDRLVCTAHGVCGCPWREQLTSSDPEGGRWCDAMTMSSGWSVGVRSLNVLLFGAVLSYASVLLLRHVRAEGRRASYTLLTLCWLLLSSASKVLSELATSIGSSALKTIPTKGSGRGPRGSRWYRYLSGPMIHTRSGIMLSSTT